MRPRRFLLAVTIAALSTLTALAQPKSDSKPSPSAAQSERALRRSIEAILEREVFQPAIVGVEIRDLKTGVVVFEKNASINLKPASTMKLFTTAAILDAEGPHSERAAHDAAVAEVMDAEGNAWRPDSTTVETTARQDVFGRILGDVYLIGRGDPNLSDRVDWRGLTNPFDRLAMDLATAGVTRIEGRIVGHDALFTDESIPDSWTADDLVWSYGAEVSALSAFDNTVSLSLAPGELEGDPGRLDRRPETSYLTIANRTRTGAEGSPSTLSLKRALGSREIVLEGSIPKGGRTWTGEVAAPQPTRYATTLFAEALVRNGISVAGDVFVSREKLPAGLRPIASIRGPSVAEQIRVVNKESQNLHAETLLRRLGLATFGDSSTTASLKAREEFLKRLGVRATTNGLYDGSGLSRSSIVTSRSLVDLLVAMHGHRDAAAFLASLPIAGVDGTLRRRMAGTVAERRVFAKTGSLRHVNALAGYVHALSGRSFAFAILVNHHTRPSREANEGIDEICKLLAGWK